MLSYWLYLSFGFSVVACVRASLPDGRSHANIAPRPVPPKVDVLESPVTSRNGTVLPPYTTWYYFDQLIDHNNPQLGTFQQRFYHTYEFYEPGGPIVLFTPGEVAADGSHFSNTIFGKFELNYMIQNTVDTLLIRL